ncbi:MAG: ParA family protein [Sulfurimonas sp.]|nr:ParA family protein [Sulfurimonas sp.]
MVITVAHTKGGVGKSTLAWHLAQSIVNKKVTIIDLDFQQTLYFVNIISGEHMNVLQPKTAAALIDILTTSLADIFIIDIGGFDSDINRIAISHSDKVLIPVSDSLTEVLGFKTFEGILEEINTDAKLCLVLNNIHPLTKNFDIIKEAISNENITLLDTIIRSRKVYKSSMNLEGGFKNLNKLAQKEIKGLRDELI